MQAMEEVWVIEQKTVWVIAQSVSGGQVASGEAEDSGVAGAIFMIIFAYGVYRVWCCIYSVVDPIVGFLEGRNKK